MKDAVYCLVSNETQANAILTHLRNAGFSSEISVLLQDLRDSKNISLKEDAIRGAEIGGIVGALLALTVPGIGPGLAIGPLVAAFSGAAAGGAVGGLVGGSGAFRPLGLPNEVADRLHQRVADGDILIAIHSQNPAELEKAVRIFRSDGAQDIYDASQEAA